MMPLMFTSAIFYTLADLPPSASKLLSINPLVHFMELIHASCFYSITDEFVNYTYMLLWSTIPLYIGLKLYIRLSKAIVSQ